MQIEYAKVSALGDRQDNQDRAAIVVSDEAALMLVFDGMGGHSDGAKAAESQGRLSTLMTIPTARSQTPLLVSRSIWDVS